MAFSPSVPERTPSTAITGDGQAWVDFSARSLQPDGKHDGGDALELAARRNGESKAAKSNTLREAARMLVREARDALEGAARAGEEPPAWVAQIMTEAGWQRYHSLCAESTATQTTSRGVAGFLPAGMTTHAGQEQIASTSACPLATTEALHPRVTRNRTLWRYWRLLSMRRSASRAVDAAVRSSTSRDSIGCAICATRVRRSLGD